MKLSNSISILCCFFTISIFIAGITNISAQTRENVQPNVLKVLDEAYGDWNFLKPNEEVREFFDREYKNSYPSFIKGDFNGDGLVDIAALISYPNRFRGAANVNFLYDFVVLFSRRHHFELTRIDSGLPLNDIVYLNYLEKGTSIKEFDSDKTITLKQDAISFSFFEKAGSVYFFEDGKFKTLTTGD